MDAAAASASLDEESEWSTEQRLEEVEEAKRRDASWNRRWRRWVGFWEIPKVRFVQHAISSVSSLVVLLSILMGALTQRTALELDYGLVVDLAYAYEQDDQWTLCVLEVRNHAHATHRRPCF